VLTKEIVDRVEGGPIKRRFEGDVNTEGTPVFEGYDLSGHVILSASLPPDRNDQ
jgi:hypothetical protein